MIEIGGYFGLEELMKREYYNDVIGLNTGRNALLYLLRAKKIRKVYLPYYLCGSLRDMLKKQGYELEYYHIDTGLNLMFEKKMQSDEILYIVNYYGKLTDDETLSLKKKYGQIIMDNTQAFFQKPIRGIDTIYSCRKFFGVPDGAYLSTAAFLGEELETDLSKDRMGHVLGRYEGLASDYYSVFREKEQSLKDEPLRYMSKFTHNILGAVDYESVRSIRNNNYAYLEKRLTAVNKFKFLPQNGPFAYPFWTEDGIEIRKRLAEKKIYIPTLWPEVLEGNPPESAEYQFAANLLPLPCDQRYGENDMEFMINELLNYIDIIRIDKK